jgi:uncharacterized protein
MPMNHRSFCWVFIAAMSLPNVHSASMGSVAQSLHQAAAQGNAQAVHALLAQGVNLEARNPAGATALLVATHHNHVDVARVLMEAGADVNAQDLIQDSPYLYAGARGFNGILKMTLEHRADLKSTNRFGGTALIPAAERGHVQTVQMLIALDRIDGGDCAEPWWPEPCADRAGFGSRWGGYAHS